jgi:hypothetical protein
VQFCSVAAFPLVLQAAHAIVQAAHMDAPTEVPRFPKRLDRHAMGLLSLNVTENVK